MSSRSLPKSLFASILLERLIIGAPGTDNRARAAEQVSALSVGAEVGTQCDIGGSASQRLPRGLLDFGRIRRIGQDAPAVPLQMSTPIAGALPLWCSDANAMPLVRLDQGLHALGGLRHMQGPGGALVAYELLRGASRQDGQWDENAYPVRLSGEQTENIPVYGLIPALNDDAPGGSYHDTVTVQLDF